MFAFRHCTRFHSRALGFAWLVVMCVASKAPAFQIPDSREEFLLGSPSALDQSPAFAVPAFDRTVSRWRRAPINSQRAETLPIANQRVIFNLFDDVSLAGRIQHVELRSAGSVTCAGTLTEDGPLQGQFVMAIEDGAMIANVWSRTKGDFAVRSDSGGAAIVQQLDATRFGGCGCGPEHQIRLPVNAPPPALLGSDPNGGAECARLIDVMVLYTAQARDAVGSDAAIRALAFASVASANLACENSAAEAQFRLVYTGLIEYQESGDFAVDLIRMRTPGDGYLDDVFGLREQHHADLVSLIVGSVTGGCGVAYVMNTPAPDFREFAFSVVQQSCAVSNLSFAHELCHNLGCQHDWDSGSLGVFAYSHGHRFTGHSGADWRTVMAYASGTRVAQFSNPDILFDGVPSGVTDDQPFPADNARTITEIVPLVGAFSAVGADDCNHNGMPDGCDILEGVSLDANDNGIPDECDSPPCAADDVIELTASDAESFNRFGSAVSLADDRIAIGSEQDNDLGSNSGSAYVYRQVPRGRNSASGSAEWVLEGKLLADDGGVLDHFGRSIAITPRGDYVLAGAYRSMTSTLSDVGAAYIFRRDGSRWFQDAKLANPDAAQADWFGWSAAMFVNADGRETAVVGALFDDQAASDAGAVYVYIHRDSSWILQVKLMADDAKPNDRLGYSLAAASSGGVDRIIAGAAFDDGNGIDSGSAYVFRRVGESWILETKLTANDARAGDRFGQSVSLAGDRALVGATGVDDLGDRSGAAYVFDRVRSQWTQSIKLHAADAKPMDVFGASVCLSVDRAVVGAVLHAAANSASGAVYVFHHDQTGWRQQSMISSPHGAPYDNFGNAVSVSPSGATAAAGAYLDDHHNAVDGGSVSVFSLLIEQPDCNGNGIPDACDISTGASADSNGNGVPDECEAPACVGDVFGNDGMVNVDDLLLLINHWGRCARPCTVLLCPGDVNLDCAVDGIDLNELIAHWGQCGLRD